ncbi:malonyl-CoA decarboxylase domain-containing protein, partial [Pseudorhodoplanes sp.]|uniref:malonyl-CoA decarboxylase domain-containing protein n=1 Tax=Pseudorhodoplanes sp. TaxID=1934341 RepID=UPI00391C7783
RCCFAFFHPALNDEPLIFVEVALTAGIPGAIAPILAENREILGANEVDTAVFYSISNCQRGLAGVSFGNFLIKQVVEEVSRENPRLKTFVTLSPVPGFASWLKRERYSDSQRALSPDELEALSAIDTEGWWQSDEISEAVAEPLKRAAAWYFLHARNARGLPADPVARFHLGNGARLERINYLADLSENGLRQSHSIMVNYLYDLDDIEKNHEAYAENRMVVAANAVKKLARPGPAGELVTLPNKI